jgi:hypothetical protein
MNSVYKDSSDVITLISEDFTGRKLFKKRSNANDAETIMLIFQSIIDKYGLNIEVIEKKNNKLSWLDEDEKFEF